jgi:hypothetical protein
MVAIAWLELRSIPLVRGEGLPFDARASREARITGQMCGMRDTTARKLDFPNNTTRSVGKRAYLMPSSPAPRTAMS